LLHLSQTRPKQGLGDRDSTVEVVKAFKGDCLLLLREHRNFTLLLDGVLNGCSSSATAAAAGEVGFASGASVTAGSGFTATSNAVAGPVIGSAAVGTSVDGAEAVPAVAAEAVAVTGVVVPSVGIAAAARGLLMTAMAAAGLLATDRGDARSLRAVDLGDMGRRWLGLKGLNPLLTALLPCMLLLAALSDAGAAATAASTVVNGAAAVAVAV